MRWPEVTLAIAYAVLNEFRAWRISRTTTVVRQAVESTADRVADVEGAAAARLGEPLLRRETDHDDPTDPERTLPRR